MGWFKGLLMAIHLNFIYINSHWPFLGFVLPPSYEISEISAPNRGSTSENFTPLRAETRLPTFSTRLRSEKKRVPEKTVGGLISSHSSWRFNIATEQKTTYDAVIDKRPTRICFISFVGALTSDKKIFKNVKKLAGVLYLGSCTGTPPSPFCCLCNRPYVISNPFSK